MTGNITRLGAHSWRLKFDGERDPITGRRKTHFLTVHGTKKAAQAELTRQLAALQTGTMVEPSTLSVGPYLEQWLAGYAKHRVSAKTFERYAEIVRKHLVPEFGTHLLAKLSPLHLQNYYSEALQRNRVRMLRSGIAVTLPPLAAMTVSEASPSGVEPGIAAGNAAAPYRAKSLHRGRPANAEAPGDAHH